MHKQARKLELFTYDKISSIYCRSLQQQRRRQQQQQQ